MIIYLSLNFPATKRELRKRFLEYNTLVAEKNKQVKEGKKKKKIARSGEWEVLITLMEFYSAHLYNNYRLKKPNELRPFRTNNVAIAGKTGPNGISPRTVKRHIIMLMKMGIITKKIWHGTNSSFEVYFNPRFLVAKQDFDFTSTLQQKYQQATRREKISDTELTEILKHSPSFETHPFGILDLTNCPHIPTCTFNKFNDVIGIVNFLNELKISMTSGHESNNEFILKNYGIHEGCENGATNVNSGEFQKPDVSREKISSAADELIRKRTFFVFMAWQAAKTILYKDYLFNSEHRISIAKQHLTVYFSDHLGNPLKNYQKHYHDFLEIITNQRNTLRKAMHRFAPPADRYFDPLFKTKNGNPAGFYAAKWWYDNVILPARKKNTEYYSNNRLLSESFRSYSRDMSVHNYRQIAQCLGKKSDKSLINDFNRFVLNSQHENTGEYFAKRWKKHLEGNVPNEIV